MDARARITLPDVLFLLMSLAFLGALYPVFMDGFRENVSIMSTGTAYLLQMVLPLAVLVLLSVIYVKAIAGSGA